MPKGKNAAALFEVINQGRRPEPGQSITRTPSWWFKRSATPAPAAETPHAIHIDRDQHIVHFRMSLASAIISLFAIVVLIIIGFLVGQHFGRKSAPMTAITTEDLLKSEPNPQVMDVSPPPERPVQPTDNAAPQPARAERNEKSAENMQRQAGLNYVIMQSYPPDMESSAVEAEKVLRARGIPCTVEPAPSRLRLGRGWVSVVGTTGFSSISGSEYKNYIRTAESANSSLTGKFKKLTPLAYKW